MKTGYLGPSGTYSELAHDKLFSRTQKVLYNNFYAIFKAVYDGEVDAAVIPMENALEGSVTQCLDLLLETQDIFVTRQTSIDINHRLMLKDGANLNDIDTVFSHEQAIKQCGRFLSENLSGAKIVFTDSTSASAELCKAKNQACIVGSHLKKLGYYFLEANIADRQSNSTRFGVLQKGKDSIDKNCQKILIAASSLNKPGALLNLLTILNDNFLNMTKIESRPLKTRLGEYVFFIEFEGNIKSPKVKSTLEKLEKTSFLYKLLGCY